MPTELLKTDKYKICFLTSDRFDDFVKFNNQIYLKKKNMAERFQHQILNNPLLKDKSKTLILVAYNTENQIVGQLVCTPYKFYLGNQLISGINGYDVVVLKKYRKIGIAKSLYFNAREYFKKGFGIMFSKIARAICTSLQGEIIGYMQTFIWINNPLCIPKALGHFIFKDNLMFKPKAIQNLSFPTTLSVDNYTFNLVNSLDNWTDYNWDDNTFITSRSLDFIKWRFFNSPNKYYFYLLNEPNQQTYFTLKTRTQRGANILEIVDYRIPYKDAKKFKLILDAAKLLTKQFNFDALATTSTHKFFDEILEKSSFIKRGGTTTYEIILFLDTKTDDYKKNIKERSFAIATTIDLISEVDTVR